MLTLLATLPAFSNDVTDDAGQSALRRRVPNPAPLEYLSELLAVQSAVVEAAGDLKRVMNAVINGAIRIIPHAAGAIVELIEGDDLIFHAASGTSAAMVGHRLRKQGSLSGYCIALGQPQICSDTEIHPFLEQEACRRIGVRSMIIVPLPLQGRYVGVLKIHADHTGAFTEHDLLNAQLLAGAVTTGLANAAQIEATKRFAATFEQAAVGIAHVAPDGRFLMVNDRFCKIAGWAQEDLIAGGFQKITHPDDLEADLENLTSLLKGEISHYAMEKRYIRDCGSSVWVNLTVSLVRYADGTPDFFVSVIEDISAHKAAEQAAFHDALTGLPNRRWLLDRLTAELMLATPDAPLCVAYLDLDGFKSVNDRFGHPEGDKCLVAISGALRGALRKDDVVGRMAGDEFVVILRKSNSARADSLLKLLSRAVRNMSDATPWNIGVSIGAVTIDAGSELSAEHVLSAADKLLYRVKRSPGERQIITRLLPSGRIEI